MERNVGLCIVFSVITCGIYGIYWFIVLTNETNALLKKEGETSGGIAFLFSLITCGIYAIYWAYQMGSKVSELKGARGQSSSEDGILFLVLSIFGLGIIAYCLIQNEINVTIKERVEG